MLNAISTNSIIDARNRFYTACNIIATVALLALKEAASLNLTAFTLLGLTTLTANYFTFDSIARSSLSNKKKFIPLQIALIGLIVLGSAGTNVILLSTGLFLSKFSYALMTAKIGFCIADLPLYMFILGVAFSPLKTASLLLHFFTIHNRLLQELRPLNWTSYERPLIQVTSIDCFQFILSLITEAITRGTRDETDANQNTVIFEHSAILAPYLTIHIHENGQPILNPSRFLEISEYLQAFPQEVGFEEDRAVTFQRLLVEFQRLSIDLQKKYSDEILQHHDLQSMIPNDLRNTLEEYHRENITLATDLDTIITTGLSFNKKMVEFAQKKPHLQTLDELKNIMIGYISLQNFLRENLGRQPDDTDGRKRLTSLINSLYFLYEKNIVPIRFQFPDDTSDDDMDQPAWNYLSTKFPRDFFENLPEHLFSNRQDSDKLDEDFNKYKIGTAGEFITKIFDGDIAVFRESRREKVIEKLIHYCRNNSPSNRYTLQFLKIQEQAHRIIKISTAIFTSVIAPLLVHPIAFGIGSLYSVICKLRTTSLSIHDLSTSLFGGFLLSVSPLGSWWSGRQFGARYIVPLIP